MAKKTSNAVAVATPTKSSSSVAVATPKKSTAPVAVATPKKAIKAETKPAAKLNAKSAAKAPALKADIAALPRAIGHVIIYVDHWNETLNWYQNVLGLSTKFAGEGWAEFATEGTTLALHGSDGECHGHQAKETGICFSVENVDKTLSVLREREVKVVTEPHEVCENTRCASIADPEGNLISIVGK
ncbi:MAG: VOC family protein [Planctomycetes bacterium]|nr:VOC family protein [Planctomycetota bacterium]